MTNREFYVRLIRYGVVILGAIAGYLAIQRHELKNAEAAQHQSMVKDIMDIYIQLPPEDVAKRRSLAELIYHTTRDPDVKIWAAGELDKWSEAVEQTKKHLDSASEQAARHRARAEQAASAAQAKDVSLEERNRLEEAAAQSAALAKQAELREREWSRRLELPRTPASPTEFVCIRTPEVSPRELAILASDRLTALQQCWNECRDRASCSVIDVVDRATGKSVQSVSSG
jgi:hypothetical protein